MSELNVAELNLTEMEQIVGGFKKPRAKKGYTIYKIVRGDTLTRIARRFNTTVQRILAANPKIKNRNLIRTGDYLYIR